MALWFPSCFGHLLCSDAALALGKNLRLRLPALESSQSSQRYSGRVLLKLGGSSGRFLNDAQGICAVSSDRASASSRPSAYFQSMRAPTASAAWRSENPSVNSSDVARANRPGASAGLPAPRK
jgi:hypothetical protein